MERMDRKDKMPKAKEVEVICPSGMITLSELDHLELLEAVYLRFCAAEKRWKRTKKDADLGVTLELSELYAKLDVESTPEIKKLRAEYPHAQLMKDLREEMHGQR